MQKLSPMQLVKHLSEKNIEFKLVTYLYECFGFTQVDDIPDAVWEVIEENSRDNFAYDFLLVAYRDHRRDMRSRLLTPTPFSQWLNEELLKYDLLVLGLPS